MKFKVSALSVKAGFLIKFLFIFSCIPLFFLGCDNSVKKRPYGYYRLGTLKDFLGNEENLANEKLVVRRDSKGLYVMSTMCTYDLTYLVRKTVEGREIYVSDYSDSKYDLDGHIISGPTRADLPHYQLKIDSGTYGGPKDTLYAVVGEEVSREWRLELPGGQ